ncbi:hypothetical protein ACV3T0_13815 [Clostridium perfringens]
MSTLDRLDELNDAMIDFKLSQKSIAEIHEEKLEKEFLAKIESYLGDENLKNAVGKYADVGTEDGARLVNFVRFLDECVELSKNGTYKDGHVLHMTTRHAKNLKDEAAKMFNYIENIELKTAYDSTNGHDMQPYINERSIGTRGENKESTMQGIKTKIQKVNLLESIARGEIINYSSNIKTTGELEEMKQLKKSKITRDDNKNKQMKNSDYEKVFNPLFEKLQKDPASVTEAEAAFLVMGEFGLRPSSAMNININQVDVKKGTIEVEIEQNKSKQMFIAKSDYENPSNMVAQQLLSGLYRRAALLYDADKDENIKLINCCEQALHQGFTALMKKYEINMDNYSGKYKLLRHRFAQNMYDQIRSTYTENTNMSETDKITRALKEVNYLMGHEAKKIKTTMGYIKNIW